MLILIFHGLAIHRHYVVHSRSSIVGFIPWWVSMLSIAYIDSMAHPTTMGTRFSSTRAFVPCLMIQRHSMFLVTYIFSVSNASTVIADGFRSKVETVGDEIEIVYQ